MLARHSSGYLLLTKMQWKHRGECLLCLCLRQKVEVEMWSECVSRIQYPEVQISSVDSSDDRIQLDTFPGQCL